MNRFRHAIRPGATVVDVGAYLGLFTMTAAQAVGPFGRVVAFEPAPTAFSCLSASVAANGFTRRVELINAAAAEFAGTSSLALNSSDPSQNTTVQAGRMVIEVPACRVADVVEVSDVSVCKIDVEGAEAAVLRGIGSDLESISDLFVECNPAGLAIAGESPATLADQLEQNGYVIDIIDEKTAKVVAWPMDLTGRSYVNFHARRW